MPWLLTIARRVCAEEIIRRQRDRHTAARLANDRPAATGDMAGRIDLLDALARLAQHRREALVLTAVVGLSYADAAAVCGCPVGTIRSRVARARGDLTRALSLAPTANARPDAMTTTTADADDSAGNFPRPSRDYPTWHRPR